MAGDDYSADLTTSGVVAVGGSAGGELESDGDRDWFRVSLQAGASYWFGLAGLTTGNGTLRDPYLYLYDASGEELSKGDDSGGGVDSRLTFTAPASGYYYLGAASNLDSQMGDYRLTTGQYTDDYSGRSPGELAVGGSLSGDLEVKGDVDWVRLELTAGVTYTITAGGVDAGQGTLADPYIYLYDSDSEFAASADDGGGRRSSLLTFTPSLSGAYYLGVGAYDDASAGTYQISLSTLTDDVPDGSGSQGGLSLGGSTQGRLEQAGDKDRFTIELTAGQTYCFDLKGSATGQGDLADPYLGLYDATGLRLAWDDDGGQGLDSRLVFTATTSGSYYLEASGFAGRQAGSYVLSAWEASGLASQDAPLDDAGAGPITSLGAHERQLDPGGAHDWVAVLLEAATSYLFTLEGQEGQDGGGGGGGGGLDSPLLGLADAGGVLVGAGTAGGAEGVSQLGFTPQTSGVYYVDIGAQGQDDSGRYLLSVVGRQVQEFASGQVFGSFSAQDPFAVSGQVFSALAAPGEGQGEPAALVSETKTGATGALASAL